MAFKNLSRLPPMINTFKSIKISTNRILVQANPILYNFCKNIDVRLVSTNKKSSQDSKEIYYGVLTPQIKSVKIFSLTSSIVGIIAQPFLYKEVVSTGNVPVIIATYSFIGFFTFITPILLHFITKKYITHLTYNESKDTYTATTVNFFCIPRKTEFTPDDVVVPDVPGMFTSFKVKGKPLFLDPRYFGHPEHYSKIMGYDKPIDFKLYESTPDTTKK